MHKRVSNCEALGLLPKRMIEDDFSRVLDKTIPVFQLQKFLRKINDPLTM